MLVAKDEQIVEKDKQLVELKKKVAALTVRNEASGRTVGVEDSAANNKSLVRVSLPVTGGDVGMGDMRAMILGTESEEEVAAFTTIHPTHIACRARIHPTSFIACHWERLLSEW